jgi:hypothetical protein
MLHTSITRAHCRAMDVMANGHHPQEDDLPAGWRWTLPRALGVAAFLAMAIFWIWAFQNTDSIPHPDEFDDPAFVDAAESICAARQAAINDLPSATTVKDAEERSVLVAAGTVELERMVVELAALPLPVDPKGADGVTRWLADYEVYLDDRRIYADVLATGEDPPFTISGNAEGVRITDLLGTFAEVNNMPDCAPSGDV